MLVSANQIVLNGAKIPAEWNTDLNSNWLARFKLDAVSEVPHEWVDAIFVNFSKIPCVLKDPQLLWTFQKWWPIWQPQDASEEMKPRIAVLFKFPVDFVASVLHGVEIGWWPHVPKDPDYLVQLWTEWYQNVLKLDDGSFFYFHSTDQLCSGEGINRVNEVFGSSLSPLDATMVHNRIRRDTASMPKETWQLYDKIYFKTLRKLNG